MQGDIFQQQFGGDWTEIKLGKIEKYLRAYAQIMKNRSFVYAYIDAFAGTGYRVAGEEEQNLLLPLIEQESQRFLDGSARIALKVTPRFSKYVFIEKDTERFKELTKLKTEFPHLADDIILENRETNAYIQELCNNKNWRNRRAVLFLDPFGM